jgi:alpha-1,3-glucan synthase
MYPINRKQPLDFSLLDKHYGTIQQWRSAIDEIHRRGMYVMADSTYGTSVFLISSETALNLTFISMADLLGFEGFLNSTAPLNPLEYRTVWKEDQKYFDFSPSNQYKKECKYPIFYSEVGVPIGNEADFLSQLKGCYDSDFDQVSVLR